MRRARPVVSRRLKEDRNRHFGDLECACWTDPKVMARFKEQPKMCSGPCCGNPRRWFGDVTMQEKRAATPVQMETVS